MSLGFIALQLQIETAAAMGAHPYAPAELNLPGYVPLRLSQLEILAAYLGTSLFVLLAVWLVSGTVQPPSSKSFLSFFHLHLPTRDPVASQEDAADYPRPTACSCAGGRSPA